MAILKIVNLTGSIKSYLSGSVTVSAFGTTSVSDANQYSISSDGGLRNDCLTDIVNLYDDTITYGTHNAIDLLDRILNQTNTIIGATDGSRIGNTSDRLKTDASITSQIAISDRVGSGTITSGTTPNDVVTVNTQGMDTLRFLVTGTWVGTMRVEGLINGTWKLATANDGSQAIFAAQTANNEWYMQCGGFSQVRLRMSAYTSGTANVEYSVGVGPGAGALVWNTNAASLKMEMTTRAIDSSLNSSTALLNSSAVFTGTWENVSSYAAITFSIFSDQASASNGLSVQWSGDGVNTDVTDGSNVSANAGRAFSLTPRARYFRIVYTNGGTNQTIFRLYTNYHYVGSGLISRLLSSTIDDNNFAQTVRAITNAKKSDGTYGATALTANSDFKTSDGLRNGGVYGNLALTTANTAYEAKVGGSRLTNRKSLTITASDDMFWGLDNSVTTSSGTPLYKNQSIEFSIDPDSTFQVWLVASGNSKNARVTEAP